MIDPLVNWVEKGTAPNSVVAKARGVGTSSIAALINAEVPTSWAVDRSRPLCPYPTVATYNGSGDLNQASSFSCK
jgi:feruloyl esterase